MECEATSVALIPVIAPDIIQAISNLASRDYKGAKDGLPITARLSGHPFQRRCHAFPITTHKLTPAGVSAGLSATDDQRMMMPICAAAWRVVSSGLRQCCDQRLLFAPLWASCWLLGCVCLPGLHDGVGGQRMDRRGG